MSGWQCKCCGWTTARLRAEVRIRDRKPPQWTDQHGEDWLLDQVSLVHVEEVPL